MTIPRDLLHKIDKLEPLPVTIQKLIPALNDENVSLSKIAKIIEYDHALASNILRMANSSLYGTRFEVASLRDAVIRLGTSMILDTLLGHHLRKLTTPAPMYDLTEDDLWLHAAVASTAVNCLIRECPKSEIPPSASVAALVHDVGKLIMVRFLKADVKVILQKCTEENLTFAEAEQAIFGFDHAEVGAALAQKWAFPESIRMAIAYHHKDPLPVEDPTVDAVVIANLAAKTIGVGLGAEGMKFTIDSNCRRRLGLSFESFCRVCAQTNASLADLKSAYGMAA